MPAFPPAWMIRLPATAIAYMGHPMKKRIAAALAATLLVGGAPAAEWKRLESEHFTLTTGIGMTTASAYLEQLEAFRWLVLKVLGADEKSVRAQARLDVVLLFGQESLRWLYPELPEHTAGVYQFCEEGALAVGTYDMRRRHQDFNQIVLQHEYAHHLMFQYATIAYPVWYVEGFAEYMATVFTGDGVITLGENHLSRSRVLLRGGTWLPYADVLRWPQRQRPANDLEVEQFYAQSWVLVHYMLSDARRAHQLADYHARTAAGEDTVAAFESATGLALADLPDLLRTYLGQMKMLEIDMRSFERPKIDVVFLGNDAGAYLAHATTLRSCVTSERGHAILAILRAAAPDVGKASVTLRLAVARAESRFGDAKVATTLLDDIAAAEPQNAEAQYLLGRAWLRLAGQSAGDEQAQALERARGHLFKAYRLNKADAPTLYYLAQVLATKGIDANVLNAARGARALAPAVNAYAVFEARLELAAGDRERAARALGPLASNPHQPERSARMRQAVEAIKAGKPAAEVAALIEGPAPPKTAP
jgi:hypothetical protein